MVQLDDHCGCRDHRIVNYDAARQHRGAMGHWKCDILRLHFLDLQRCLKARERLRPRRGKISL